MRNTISIVKNKLISKYLTKDTEETNKKSTDINILLNRVRLNKKRESRKKIFFSAITSFGLVIFGFLVF